MGTIPQESAVNVGLSRDVLETITDPAVHLALWSRGRLPMLSALDDLDWDAIDDIDQRFEVPGLEDAIGVALSDAGYPAGAETDFLRDDVVDLARTFAGIMACDSISLRLEIVETNACRKFHADMVSARLLSTYSGPATQWVRAEAHEDVNDLQPGDVAIFKGRLATDEPLVLHRSPPIEASGATRLLLVVNPARDGAPLPLPPDSTAP